MSGFVVVACGILASTASIDLSFIRGVGSVCARLSSIGATTLVIYVLSDTVGRLPGFIFGGIATTFMILLWLAGNPEDRAIFFRLLVFILKMIFRLLLFIVKMIFWYPGVLLSTGLGYIKGWIQKDRGQKVLEEMRGLVHSMLDLAEPHLEGDEAGNMLETII